MGKIWLLVGCAPYEGYDYPQYAYSSEKRAEEELKRWVATNPIYYGDRDVLELELDIPYGEED